MWVIELQRIQKAKIELRNDINIYYEPPTDTLGINLSWVYGSVLPPPIINAGNFILLDFVVSPVNLNLLDNI